MIGPVKIQLPSNSSLLIWGPSETGKTTLLLDIIANTDTLYATPVHKIIFYYSQWQPVYDELQKSNPSIVFVENQQQAEEAIASEKGHKLCIFDDHFQSAVSETNKFLFDLLTIRCHHDNTSVIMVTHIVFDPKLKNLVTNFQQFVFTNIRNSLSVSTFLQQYSRPTYKQLLNHYEYLMNKQEFGTFFFSKHPKTSFDIRVRSSVVPRRGTIVFK